MKRENTSTMPAANKVVYAKFKMVQYHVSLDADGGIISKPQDAEFNVDPHTVLNRDSMFQNTTWPDSSHELVGWFYKDGPNAGKVYDYGEVLGPVNLIAKWRIPGQVVIEYDAGEGGSGAPLPAGCRKARPFQASVEGKTPPRLLFSEI